MEVNTVCISVEKYNELREFKENIERGNSFVVRSSGMCWVERYISNNDVVKNIALMNQRLVKRIDELEAIKEPKYPYMEVSKRFLFWKYKSLVKIK